ncbi:hypothetical protein ACIBG8_34165 [Nonomuraea sp. NPDC050556]|uniref:hypothetical protein n=1 Tax=Nonomuraea sp. NPDC050556 TaxID=3364369 RepID=UPI0037A5E705
MLAVSGALAVLALITGRLWTRTRYALRVALAGAVLAGVTVIAAPATWAASVPLNGPGPMGAVNPTAGPSTGFGGGQPPARRPTTSNSATPSSDGAAPSGRAPVRVGDGQRGALGGFNATDQAITLDQLKTLIKDKDLQYIQLGGFSGQGADDDPRLAWIQQTCTETAATGLYHCILTDPS